MGSYKGLENMNISSDESGLKEESMKPSQNVVMSIQERPDDVLEVDLSLSSNSHSHSHSESSASRASNTPENTKSVSKTASVSSPKNTVCSNKSDLTETSSLRNTASAKNEDQVESSLQGARVTALASLVQPGDGENKADVAQNHFDKKECSVQAATLEDNDGSRSSEEEVNICDICGDLGREKWLAVCSVCGVGAEHIYCMRVKLDEVPDNWICEDCITAEQEGKEKEDVKRKEESLSTTRWELQRENGSSVDHKNGLNSKDEERGSATGGKGKAASHISAERCENRSETPSDDQGRRSRKRRSATHQDFSVSKSTKAKTAPPSVLISTRVSLLELRKRPVVHSATGVSTNARLSSALDKSSTSERIPAYKQSTNCGANLLRDDDPMTAYNPFNGTNRPGGATPQYHVFPLPYCIWQGRFKLQRKGVFSSFCNGIQAHLSRSASQNTFSLAPEFSRDISLEEMSRSAVWATQFTANRAAAKNVHIYFFAKDPERDECGYKSLLRHVIMNDVCLRGNVGKFELLVFSSDKLEEGFQRWNAQPFLWGVFRDPKPLSFNYGYLERNADFNRAQIPQFPIESRLVNFFQMAGRTFQERPNLLCSRNLGNNGQHCGSTGPNLELSLGLGGASASVSSRNIQGKAPSLLDSSTNFHGKEPALSLSLSLPQPSAPRVTEQEDSERPRVDTTLSLLSNFG